MYLLLCFLLPLGIFGCGSDEDDASADLVGTWELITVNGETPEMAYEDEDVEVLTVRLKYVFGPDGLLVQDATVTMRARTEDFSLGVAINYAVTFSMSLTLGGRYVVSDSTLELISGASVNARLDDVKVDISAENVAESIFEQLERETEQNFREESEQEFKQLIEQEYGLTSETYTWSLEGDILTLHNGDVEVYKKR